MILLLMSEESNCKPSWRKTQVVPLNFTLKVGKLNLLNYLFGYYTFSHMMQMNKAISSKKQESR